MGEIWKDKKAVFLDLETTGLSPQQNRIIEIGALKVEGRDVVDTFETLVKPDVPIPPFVTRLTGITEEEVNQKGVDLPAAVQKLTEFIGDWPIIGHNIAFDLAFLKAAGLDLKNQTLDTGILAALLRPTEKNYGLRVLVKNFFNEIEAHRASSDARHTHRLFWELIDRVEPEDRHLLERLAGILSGHRLLLSELFQELSLKIPEEGAKPKRKKSKAGMYDKLLPENLRSRGTGQKELTPVNEEEVDRILGKEGLLVKIKNYEYRPQQVQMARLVTHAFNKNETLVVEAPSGVGKTLSYLVPAIIFAAKNQRRVVISTNTKNLQSQIWQKELPFLKKNLSGFKWRAARLLGKGNYFCRRRFEQIYRESQGIFLENPVALAYLVSFSHKSEDGVLEELSSFMQRGFPALKTWVESIKASNRMCLGKNCSFYRLCFYQKARLAAEDSDLIISNHSLTLSPPSGFPEFKDLVLDEAHNIEDAASESYGRSVESESVPGILSLVQAAEGEEKETVKLQKEADEVKKLWNQFSSHFFRLLPETGTANILEIKQDNRWPEVEIERQNFLLAWQELERKVKRLAEVSIRWPERGAESKAELAGIGMELEALRQDLEFIFNPGQNFLSFAGRKENENSWYSRAIPVEAGTMLVENLFSRLDAAVLTSATLTVAGSFDFFLGRWALAGVNRLVTSRIDSPFDFSSCTILAIPRNFRRYDYNDHQGLFVAALADGIKRTVKILRGKELILFSSRSRMEEVCLKVRGELEKEGITVLCQNVDGGRAHLAEILKESDGDVVLFGSRSFQEGVDIPGLRAVIIEKMPFPGRSDPLIAARQRAIADKGGKPFQEYILPLMIISLRQSFGRLIRSKTDRGAVIIFDPRLLSDYPQVLDSLPDSAKVIEDIPLFYEKLAAACRAL